MIHVLALNEGLRLSRSIHTSLIFTDYKQHGSPSEGDGRRLLETWNKRIYHVLRSDLGRICRS